MEVAIDSGALRTCDLGSLPIPSRVSMAPRPCRRRAATSTSSVRRRATRSASGECLPSLLVPIRFVVMKTIAISIDEPTLGALDRLARKGRVRGKRSQLVREALVEFLARRQDQEQEALERAAIAKHRSLLARQAKAMVAEQAKP